MTEARLQSKVLKLALPLMVGNLSQICISLTDTWFLGRLGENQLAAMAQAGVAYLIVFLVFSAPFMGIQTLTSRRFGQNKPEACGEIFTTGLTLQFLIGVTAGLLGVAAIPSLTEFLFGGSAELAPVIELTSGYLGIRVGGMAVMTCLWAYRGFFYGIGVTKPDLFAGIGMNLLNIVFNQVFIYGELGAPAMGMNGAALASVLATGIVTVSMTLLALRPKYRVTYGLFKFSNIQLQAARSIIKLSAPRTLQAMAFGGSIYFFKLIGDSCGKTALAASIIVWRCFGVAVLVAIALGASAATIVGQNLGAGKPEQAEAGAWAAVRIGVIINMTLGLMGFFFPDFILSLFSQDPDVVAVGRNPMRFMAFFQCVDAIGIILGRSLNAAGSTIYVMSAEIIVSLMIMAPTAYLMTRLFPGNLMALWSAWAVYVSCWATAMVLKFRRAGWKSIQV